MDYSFRFPKFHRQLTRLQVAQGIAIRGLWTPFHGSLRRRSKALRNKLYHRRRKLEPNFQLRQAYRLDAVGTLESLGTNVDCIPGGLELPRNPA